MFGEQIGGFRLFKKSRILHSACGHAFHSGIGLFFPGQTCGLGRLQKGLSGGARRQQEGGPALFQRGRWRNVLQLAQKRFIHKGTQLPQDFFSSQKTPAVAVPDQGVTDLPQQLKHGRVLPPGFFQQ